MFRSKSMELFFLQRETHFVHNEILLKKIMNVEIATNFEV